QPPARAVQAGYGKLDRQRPDSVSGNADERHRERARRVHRALHRRKCRQDGRAVRGVTSMVRIATRAAMLVALSIVSTPGFAAATGTDPIGIAGTDPTRTEADRTRGERGHTIEVLKFFGIAPGMTVVDLFAGGGYFSEVIGRIVGGGSSGKGYMHNNAAYQTFIGDALAERVKGGRLQNVVKLDAEIGQLGIPPTSVDLVVMSMSYPDLYFKADDWSVDPDALFAEVHAMLKPGGVLALIDHSAIAG